MKKIGAGNEQSGSRKRDRDLKNEIRRGMRDLYQNVEVPWVSFATLRTQFGDRFAPLSHSKMDFLMAFPDPDL
jgi:hypothetical protein